MGAHNAKGLDAVVHRTTERAGKIAVTGRYHRLPKKLEDDYKPLQTVIGSGYNGSVYLAESKTTGAKFAIKGFKLHGVSKEKKEELESECEIFLAMDHPHVATLNDAYEDTEYLHLVMECLTGGELFKRISEKRRFSEKDAADAAWQMLLAVNYIHSHDVVHRDIKLENFLYDNPESNHLKLIDFGFSKIWQPNTKMHLSCGTLAYVAPEVLNQSYGSQCDIWSLGVTVFILLFGYMPFKGTEEAQIDAIMRGRYTKKEALWEKVSTEAKDFVEKLLVVDPHKRLTAAQALEHAWIHQRDNVARESHHLDGDIADSLANFGQASHFRRACLSMMAWSLTTEERAQVQDAFIELDTDRSGTISIQEFKKALEDTFHIADERVVAAFEALDQTHHEEIHYSEFLAAMVSTRIRMHDDLLKQTFKKFDVENTGFITVHDLKEILGDAFEGESVEEMMKEVDDSGDGKISYEEFLHYLKDGGDANHHHVAATVIDQHLDKHRPEHNSTRGMKAKAPSKEKPGAEKEKANPKQPACCSVM